MSSGWSALILCLILGKRLGFGKEPMPPHNMVLCMVGTGMLWVGWYGFNAGSAVAADGIAANAFTTTTLATAVASFTWAMAEYIFRGKPSILGFCSGAVAGLVVITPACGFVTTTGAVIIGLAAGLIPYLACWKLKSAAGYDDALDTFGVHAVGGTLGALLTGLSRQRQGQPQPRQQPGGCRQQAGRRQCRHAERAGQTGRGRRPLGRTTQGHRHYPVPGHCRDDHYRLLCQGHPWVAGCAGNRSLGPGFGRARRGGIPRGRAIMISQAPCRSAAGGGGRRGASITNKTKTK